MCIYNFNISRSFSAKERYTLLKFGECVKEIKALEIQCNSRVLARSPGLISCPARLRVHGMWTEQYKVPWRSREENQSSLGGSFMKSRTG
jgi:hypothetical protein